MNSPPDVGFYLDENLDGHTFVSVLLAARVAVVRCRDLRLGGLPDEVWIPQVSEMDLVIVTADVRTRYRFAEKQAIVAAKARVIHLRLGKRATHANLAHNFVNTLPDIVRFVKRSQRPWIVTLARPATPNAGERGRLNKIELR